MSIRKNYLLTPGPTPIPDSVRMAMSQAAIHHRSAAFREIMAEVRSGLKELYQTNAEVLIFTASGTGAMEGAVVN
ncbi:MAG: aminotransferase class V-fold PLP-dependent enzyme, partial [Deltaproteobacteria bacterium]